MKEYEYAGTIITMFAYCMVVSGNIELGCTIGLLGNFALICFYGAKKLIPTVGLQFFFVGANIYGIYNAGIIT